MEWITTDTAQGARRVPIYHYSEIPFTQIMIECEESKRRGISYLEIPCAFDIETTNVYKRNKQGQIDNKFRPFAFMYHWQFCIDYRVIFGRTWSEFQKLLASLEKNMDLSKNHRLVVYVHNLSFEFQFMRHFLHVTDSFCKSERNPLKIVHNECVEFRCSAALSNMNLDIFCKNENSVYRKLTDTFDYAKIRTQETELSETEKGYCYNDVRGLCEAVKSLMRFDTLATIPMTSTGYVRRDARNSMRKNKKNRRSFKDSALSADEYLFMRAAFRGGDTHANSRYANQIINEVHSFDVASSYPACMMINKFPMSKFVPITFETARKMRTHYEGQFAFLLHVAFTGIKFIAPHGIPYIAISKCKSLSQNHINDNGRVLEADHLSIWLTDIDVDIIQNEYTFDDMRIEKIYASRYGFLSDEYKSVIMDYYRKKTELKGSKDEEEIYLYGKSKNRLNALYGMMAMRIDQTDCHYTGDSDTGYQTDEKPLADQIAKYYRSRNSFLSYQHGVWVTAHARKRLHDFYNIAGKDLIYGDTDSGKIIHLEKHKDEIDKLNERLKIEAETVGAYADDREGKRHFMGVWEYEGCYRNMKTLGAKKYCAEVDGKIYSTIAGVNKKRGTEFFTANGIESFKIGQIIENSGHLVAYYNDDDIHDITVDGVTMVSASNLALIDDTYTIGVTSDYMNILLRNSQNILDM